MAKIKSNTTSIVNELDIDKVSEFIRAQSSETKIYIGGDSRRMKRRDGFIVEYAVVVVVHYDGCHGGKVFGEIHIERDYDRNLGRPAVRLMTEVYKISELFLKLQDAIGDRYVEVHLDLNPDEQYGSSCVVQQATGYIRGVCGLDPHVKPDAFAATYCADHLQRKYAKKSRRRYYRDKNVAVVSRT